LDERAKPFIGFVARLVQRGRGIRRGTWGLTKRQQLPSEKYPAYSRRPSTNEQRCTTTRRTYRDATSLIVRMLSCLILVLLWPIEPATAHGPFEGGSGFFGGVVHPLFVLAHVLAIVATGLLVGQQMPRSPWFAVSCYAAGLVAGFAAITLAFVPRLAGESLLAAAAVSAALTALARPIPKFLIVVLTLVTGLALGLDSPPHVTSAQEASAILIGTFCGAVILLLVVAEGTIMLWREWQRLGVRVVGSWIAASAIMVLALALAR